MGAGAVGLTVAALTTTVQFAVLFPSTVLTFIVAVPGATPVIFPSETFATELLLELQVTALFAALSGHTVAFRVSLEPTVILMLVLFNFTLVGNCTAIVGETMLNKNTIIIKVLIHNFAAEKFNLTLEYSSPSKTDPYQQNCMT